MATFFGFKYESKKEREENYQAYFKKIFPYGELQKRKVEELLNELINKRRRNQLMLHYILIKEAMIDSVSKDYDAIAAEIEKKRYVKLNQEQKNCIRKLIETDLTIDGELNYPSIEELKA